MLLLSRNSGLPEAHMANVEDDGLQLDYIELDTISQSNLFPKMRQTPIGVILSSPNEDRIEDLK